MTLFAGALLPALRGQFFGFPLNHCGSVLCTLCLLIGTGFTLRALRFAAASFSALFTTNWKASQDLFLCIF
ncbi:hypothetical protein [Stutzerimonas stutzeri]|uniref:hypothetical protein n=2 Tax=Stutzerimonas stutzeri TaxID=316 RepID=UPI0032B3767D